MEPLEPLEPLRQKDDNMTKFERRFMFLVIVFQLSIIIGLLWGLLHAG